MKFAKNKTHRPAPGMRISRRPGSASKACPICNGPLRIGQIMLPSPEPDSPDRKFKMEKLRFVPSGPAPRHSRLGERRRRL